MSENIFNLIERQAEKAPGAAAIEAAGRRLLTYSRLRAHLESVIEKINAVGVGRNDRVAIVLPNGPEMATAFLAVAACATAVPLNPQYRGAEFDFFFSSLGVKLLLIQVGAPSAAAAAAHSRGIAVMELRVADGSEAGLFELVSEARRRRAIQGGPAEADDAALVLHTSGTTSRPKTVPLTQFNLAASVHHLIRSLKLGADDRCLHLLPQFH